MLITTSPAKSSREHAGIIASLIDNFYMNQLIIADIHAPMNELSDIYKIEREGEIISGWSVFHGFDFPVIVFPPTLPESWPAIQNMVSLLGYDKITIPFPKNVVPSGEHRPWENWDIFKFELLYTDRAMRLGGKDVEVHDISELPKIRGASYDDQENLAAFFEWIKKTDKSYNGFWHPLQLKSDLYVVAEDENGDFIGVAGSHFETPLSVQIGNIYVKPEWRRKGIGRALTTAVTLGIARFKLIPTLFVNENNHHAQKLYEDIGYEYYNEFEFYEGYRI